MLANPRAVSSPQSSRAFPVSHVAVLDVCCASRFIWVLAHGAKGAGDLVSFRTCREVVSPNNVTLISLTEPSQILVKDKGLRLTIFLISCIAAAASWAAAAGPELAKRYVRLYFPRTYEGLTEYEFLCYVDTYFGHLTGTQIEYMFRAIRDSGLGGLTTLGGGISWVDDFRDSWVSSSVGSAFPTDYIQAAGQIRYVETFKLVVARGQDVPPVFHPFLELGIENHLGRQAAELGAKDGATVFATMVSSKSEGMPFATAWRYGQGVTWSVATDIQTNYNLFWTRLGGGAGYEYAMDLFLNMVLYSTGRDIPQDILQFHAVRQRFAAYRERKSMIYALLDFVERFGVNRQTIDEAVEEVDQVEADARSLYLVQDIPGASEALERAMNGLADVEERSIQLKNRALLWVYLVEWTAVTGTLMVSGSILWSVMVRRRAYRVVGTTRLA
jgi:hypothetical protein